MLIEIIKKYYNLHNEYQAIKKERDELNSYIKHWMIKELDENYLLVDEYALRIQTATSTTYETDSLIEYLKSIDMNELIEIKEVVNIDKLKELIDNGIIDKSEINKYEHVKNKFSLFVRERDQVKDLSNYIKIDI